MIYKGVVSGLNGSVAQVNITALNTVAPAARIATHISDLLVGMKVLIVLLNGDLSDSCVIGVIG